MIHSARLTSSGIAVSDDAGAGLCGPCFRPRSSEIRYWDVISVGEQADGIVELTYLSRAARPFRMKSAVLRIVANTKVARHGSQEHLRSGDGATAAAGAAHEGPERPRLSEIILDRAYANVGLPEHRPPALVLVNPHSGPGHALQHYNERAAPVFAKAGLRATVVSTRTAGEAVEIARKASMQEYGSIVSVSGDGLPHEVINGLATRPDAADALAHFALAQLPGGSGNAMSLSLNDGENDWAAVALGIVKGVAEPADLMVLTQGNSTFYSFLSQSYGIVADCDLGTEDWRWMGGARFTVGIVLKCLAGNEYPCEVAYCEADTAATASDADAPRTNAKTLKPALTVNDPVPSNWTVEKRRNLSMFYVGKMQWMSSDAHVFPAAEPLDGAMDMIMWDTSYGSVQSLRALTKFETGQHVSMIPFYKKVSAYRITPLKENYVSIDGELYPSEPFQVEVLPGVARFITPL